MSEKRDYLTVKELSELTGVSVQSIYQRLNTTLKKYVRVVKGKKCIDIRALDEVYGISLENNIKDFKQGLNKDLKGNDDTIRLLKDTLDTLREQLEQKDKQILERDKHIEELTKSLQFEQGKNKNLEDNILLLEQSAAGKPEPEPEPGPEQRNKKINWFKKLFS